MPSVASLAAIAVATVAKVLLVAVSGLWLSRWLKFKTSVKGISYITVYIFLPCLLFTRLVRGLTIESFAHLYWATILALLPIIIGFCSSKVLSRFLPVEMHGLLQLGCTFQNAVSYGLSMVFGLNGLPWLADDAAKDEAQMYVFVYNITASILLWSLGSHIVRSNKLAEDALRSGEKPQLPESSPTAATTSGKARSPLVAGWAMTAKVRDCVKPLLSAPLLASFFGLAVALTPLRDLFLSRGMEAIVGGMEVLGAGTVPLTLFVLGCNLVSEDTAGHSVPKLLIVMTCAVRLALIPAIYFAAVHALSVLSILPDSRIFKLVMLVEGAAPTAINSSVICALFGYRTKEYTRALLVQYICSIFTTSFWLTVFLWYIG